ncbi:MAG: beta-ketoacyl-[acyl-carrier-protein] synthase II [Candidatus Omnitrophota bacterium]|nr:MAG: beta-ketoacyl-[acyl-carrier-protein] synthase II [Candidatus Omnitrophota bacterium]
MRRVVVTGCGVVSPVGSGGTSFWENLIKGRSGIAKITQFDPTGFDSQIAGEVKDFNPLTFFSPKELKRTPRFVQFAIASTLQALNDSSLKIENVNPYRVGVIIGSGIGSLQAIEREYKVLLEKGPSRVSPFLIPMLITNEAAGSVAIRFNLKGLNFCTVTACASGAHAIGEAYRMIKENRADVMICGGTEACITPLGVAGFCSLKALSTRNEEPERASRPFDKERDGFVIAEGCGIVILEELEFALKRGAHIYAEVGGYAATCDAYHITAPSPEAEAPAKAMELALEEAGVSPDSSIYINAHGTSTPLNDRVETKAIKKAFGSYAEKLWISSTKSMTGHTLGAAGAIEFIACCLALKNKIIPPTVNYENPDPECDLNYTPNEAKEVDIEVALSNSLGFGGHNATLVVKSLK